MKKWFGLTCIKSDLFNVQLLNIQLIFLLFFCFIFSSDSIYPLIKYCFHFAGKVTTSEQLPSILRKSIIIRLTLSSIWKKKKKKKLFFVINMIIIQHIKNCLHYACLHSKWFKVANDNKNIVAKQSPPPSSPSSSMHRIYKNVWLVFCSEQNHLQISSVKFTIFSINCECVCVLVFHKFIFIFHFFSSLVSVPEPSSSSFSHKCYSKMFFFHV